MLCWTYHNPAAAQATMAFGKVRTKRGLLRSDGSQAACRVAGRRSRATSGPAAGMGIKSFHRYGELEDPCRLTKWLVTIIFSGTELSASVIEA